MAIREQSDGFVVLDGTLRHLPLLTAWVGSSAVYWVRPAYPATGMRFLIARPTMDGYAADLAMTCHPKRGLFRVYVPGAAFTEHCETYYTIVSLDEVGANHVEGGGILRVFSSGLPIPPPPSEQVAEASFPDGVVRRVAITEDSTGNPVFSVGEAVAVPDASRRAVASPIYAYNRATGFYYLVTPIIDATDTPTLDVDDIPADGGHDSFVPDSSGFFRRVECVVDEAGVTALQIGEIVK